MRILLLVRSLGLGGVERVALAFLKGLQASGHEVCLGLLEHEVDLLPPEEKAPEGILVAPQLAFNEKGFWYYPNALIRFPYYAARTRSLLRETRPDIVFTFCLESLISMGLVRVLPNPPLRWFAMIGSDTHEGVALRFPSIQGVCAWFFRLVYSRPDVLLASSEGLRRKLLDLYRFSEKRVKCLPNPIDLDGIEGGLKLRKERDGPYFLALGRLIPPKGFSLLIRAFAAARSELGGLRLVILGKGPQKETLERLRDKLGLQSLVELPGFEANPWSLMAGSTAVIVPSFSEGFSLVTAEALACGAPLIVTDCPFGPSEIVAQGKYGVVVPRGDVEAMAAALRRMAGDPLLRETLSRQGPERARLYSLEKVVGKFEDLLEECDENSRTSL